MSEFKLRDLVRTNTEIIRPFPTQKGVPAGTKGYVSIVDPDGKEKGKYLIVQFENGVTVGILSTEVDKIVPIKGRDNSHGFVFKDDDGYWKVFCGSLRGCSTEPFRTRENLETFLRINWTRNYARWWCKECKANPPEQRR